MATEAYVLNLLNKRRFYLNKQFIKYLRQVYGVGFLRASRLTLYCGVSKNYNISVNDVSPVFYSRFQREVFKKGFILGNTLKKRRFTLVKFLQQCKLYRGIRFYYKLPVRGQRTHTNRATMRRWNKKVSTLSDKALQRKMGLKQKLVSKKVKK